MAAPQGRASFSRRLYLGTLVLNVFVVALWLPSVLQSYDEHRAEAAGLTRGMVAVLQRDIASSIGRIDLALAAVADETTRETAGFARAEKVMTAMFPRLPDTANMGIADADGRVVTWTGRLPKQPITLADRAYFAEIKNAPTASLVITERLKGRITGTPQIVLVRRLERADGSFAGAAYAIVTVDHLEEMLGELPLGRKSLVLLRHLRHGTIARRPANVAEGREDLSPELLAKIAAGSASGESIETSGIDQVERTIAHHRVGSYPLQLVAGMATEEYLREWRSDAGKLTLLALLFGATTLAGARLIDRQWRRTESSLREAQATKAKLQAFFDNTPLGLAIVDGDRVIRGANLAMNDIFHTHDIDIVGQPTSVLYGSPSPFEEFGRQAYPEIYAGCTFVDEARLPRRDGTEIWCRLTGRLVDTAHPELGVAWVFEDASGRIAADLALKASEARYRDLVESQSDFVVRIDVEGNFTFVNDSFARAFDTDASQLIGRPWRDCILAEDVEVTAASIATCLTPPDYAGRTENRLAVAGETRWVAWEGHGFPGEAPEVQAVGRDISEWVIYRQKLQTLVQELDASNHELEQFAYVISHDLREPLRMISSYIDLFRRRYGDRIDGDGDTFLEFARDGARRMDHMVRDLLDFSRVGRRGDPPTTLALTEVVEAALRNLAPAIEESAATVSVVEGLPEVTGSRSELIRLIQNLVGNAIKYRHPDRPPRVTLTAEALPGEWQFAVADNGIGIEPQHFERIFEIFQRLHTRERYDGTGIGLAVCRKVVAHHGGRIWVQSEPGVGSTFTFTLPAPKGP